MTRALFLAIEVYLFWRLYMSAGFTLSWLAFLILPYIALVLSTASPQGLMVILLPLLVCAVSQNKFKEIYLVSLALYLTNPTCILVLLVVAVVGGIFYKKELGRSFCGAAFLALISLLIIAYVLFLGGEGFMPTLTNNGPLNLFLGNNASEMSYRGVAEGLEWTSYSAGQYLAETITFLLQQPYQFMFNYILKMIFWFAPFDHFRSGIGGGFQYALFAYVAVVQAVCYFLFFKNIRNFPGVELKYAMWIFVAAWLVYAIFFVKLRFRIPFDFLLFFTACFLSVRTELTFTPKRL
jgi:hypothetical protein